MVVKVMTIEEFKLTFSDCTKYLFASIDGYSLYIFKASGNVSVHLPNRHTIKADARYDYNFIELTTYDTESGYELYILVEDLFAGKRTEQYVAAYTLFSRAADLDANINDPGIWEHIVIKKEN